MGNRLATVRQGSGTRAALVDGDELQLLSYVDAGEALRATTLDRMEQAVIGETVTVADADFAPLIPQPSKVICVGLNYRDHILEMGREPPDAPTWFAKFAGALVGHGDRLELPSMEVSTKVDWEVELAVVIGRPVRYATPAEAFDAIAGYTVLNDISMRDWQTRSIQFLAGKTFERCTPVGPWLIGTDELGDGSGLHVRCAVNGDVKQNSNTDELVFGPVDLVADFSTVITLEPGDIIATGTPGGVGAARTPPEFLDDGDVVVTEIDRVGRLENTCHRP